MRVHPTATERRQLLEEIAAAAGILCASFVFTEPPLNDRQKRYAQRVRRLVQKASMLGVLR
jgi:hypothetical protein